MKKVLAGLAAAVLILVAVVSTRPSAFEVKRSMAVGAPASVLFPFVNDFRQWANWSPWEALDPAMKKSFSGAPAGEGAIYDWVGNDKVGTGRMTVLESRANERVTLQLDFFAPFESLDNRATFTFTPESGGTRVTWTMSGQNRGFLSKAVGMVMDMDAVVGADFERGLSALKALGESEAQRITQAAPSAPEALDVTDGGMAAPAAP